MKFDVLIDTILEKCWDGYTQKGVKKKGKKMVPNCVKEQLTPALDGMDDIYAETTTFDAEEGTGDTFEFHRLNEDEIDDFYRGLNDPDIIVLYQGRDLDTALQKCKSWEAKEFFAKETKGLVGTYYIFKSEWHSQGDEGELLTSNKTVHAFKIDSGYLRKQDILNNLKDADVSGLEDLL
jgi:hypothetical protein